MLYENEVIDNLIRYLIDKGYRIISSSDAYSHGYDVVAEKKGNMLYVEAKGQTSSKPNTRRYGKEFTRNQKWDHVSKAIYSAMKTKNIHKDAQVGIALPADVVHTELIEAVYPTLAKIDIHVFMVKENGEIISK